MPLLRPSAHGMTLQGGCSKVLTSSRLPAGTVPAAWVCGVGGTVPQGWDCSYSSSELTRHIPSLGFSKQQCEVNTVILILQVRK